MIQIFVKQGDSWAIVYRLAQFECGEEAKPGGGFCGESRPFYGGVVAMLRHAQLQGVRQHRARPDRVPRAGASPVQSTP